ncbi:MAG: hypothetical protein Q9227_005181 [Pyrenula ochraceoflavens]
MSAPLPTQRMKSALSYLSSYIKTLPNPVVIFSQETLSSDIDLIKSLPWIREKFYITDIDDSRFWVYYGTFTLVDKRLPVSAVFRVEYGPSAMGRDGLFVDIPVGEEAVEGGKVLRVCNTHLESLPRNPPYRDKQMTVAAGFLHEDVVRAGVIAGDLNAIEEFDKRLHVENDLKDAFLEAGGIEGDDNGWTWGNQSIIGQREKHGRGRLDKVLFCGDVKVDGLQRFGNGVVLEGKEGNMLKKAIPVEEAWVTDHEGVRADLVIE